MFSFGTFQLIPARRALLESDTPIVLGGRAFDILALLVERAGDVVSKDELIARAWPNTCVEEANLRVHVSALRKALKEESSGCRFIENIAGRGYSFVVPVCSGARSAPSSPAAVAAVPAMLPANGTLPPAPQDIIGRDDALAALAGLLERERMVSIVGPGGIGKTTLAVALANAVLPRYRDGAWLVDLTAVSDPALVTSAIASALRLPVMFGQPMAGILTHLQERCMLLLLDNCEHLADAVANIAEQLLAGAPGLTLLATGRESLRIPDERVFRLAGLTLPALDAVLDQDALTNYTALGMFARRARDAITSDPLSPCTLRGLADICRRLDGIPLAIELAVARVELLGIRGLAAGLDDCLAVLTRNRRTAIPRHQTLRAVLDWSYALLEPAERTMLQQLSVFRGTFTLQCAGALACPSVPPGPSGAAEAVLSLASKSMLLCDLAGEEVRYRMLETTRSYAAEKLESSGNQERVRRLHAVRCLDLVARAEADWQSLETRDWLARYASRITDVRAALTFCLDTGADYDIAVQLLAASSLMWIELSLLDEQRSWIVRALPHCRTPEWELRLLAALGNALFHLNGAHQDAIACFTRAYAVAKDLGNVVEQARTYSGLCANYLLDGNYPKALALGREFAPFRQRSDSPVTQIIHDRMMGLTLHFCGEQQEARRHAQRVYDAPVQKRRDTRTSGVQYDQQVAAATVLARIRWIEGYADQAARLVKEAITRALEIDHPISLCYALAVGACPVSLWIGNKESARHYIDLLTDRAARHALMQWQSWAECFQEVASGENVTNKRLPPGAQAETLYTVATTLAGPAEFARVGQGLSGWCAAELLRQKAVAAQRAGAQADDVERLLNDSMALAARQHALAWSLRTSTSMARLWRDTGRAGEALVMLTSTCRKFTEGFETQDLRQARMLISELENAR